MSETQTPSAADAPRSQAVRLVVSWLIVSVPLVYALIQTIISVIPLFG